MTHKPSKELLAKAHSLKPIIMIGNKGLTPAVQAEINQALEHHELIKIKIASQDRQTKAQIIEQICSVQHATLVSKIGHILTIYRQRNV